MQASPLKAVVFDFDGLMVNTEELYDEVMQVLCGRRQIVFTDELRIKMMGRPGEKALEVMIDHHVLREDTPAAMLEESDLLFSKLLETRLALMPGLSELLATLERAAIPKGIATSSRRKYVDSVLGRFDLAGHFSFILSAESVTHGKPHPEVYLKAAEKHGVKPGECMVLEDSHLGCRAAIAAGTFAVAVPGVHSVNHAFDGAAIVANSLADRRIYEALGI